MDEENLINQKSLEKTIQAEINEGNVLKNEIHTIRAASPSDPNEMGYRLVRITLCIVAGFLLLLMVSFICFKKMDITTELFQATKVSDSLNIDVEKVVNLVISERQNERDFMLKISQIVLLNLLLPIITGTVGFIFGSKSVTSKNDN